MQTKDVDSSPDPTKKRTYDDTYDSKEYALGNNQSYHEGRGSQGRLDVHCQ